MPWLSCPNLIHPRRRRVNAPLLRESLLCYLRPNDSFSTEHTWRALPVAQTDTPRSPRTASHGHLSHRSVSVTGTDTRRGQRPRAAPSARASRGSAASQGWSSGRRAQPGHVPHVAPGPEPVLPASRNRWPPENPAPRSGPWGLLAAALHILRLAPPSE